MLGGMINRHAHNIAVSVRIDAAVRDSAKDALDDRDWKIAEFVETCLRAVAEEPDRTLKAIRRHRAVRVLGRPRRNANEVS
jgi:hypothetical protein